MVDQAGKYLEQLGSTDPDVRRAAILALRAGGASQAVSPLLHVAHTDPDMTLRDLARDAAYAIGQVALSPSAADPPLVPVPAIRPIQLPPRRVTGREKRLARRRLNQALNLQIVGKQEQAIGALADALRADPDITHNPSLRGLATTITDLPVEQAMAYLTQRSKDPFLVFEDDLKPVFAVTPEMTGLIRDTGILFILLLPLSLVLVNGANLLIAISGGKVNLLQTSAPLNGSALTALAVIRASLILLAVILVADIGAFFVGQIMGGVGLLYPYMRRIVRLQIVITLVIAGLMALNAMTILSVPASKWEAVTQSVLVLSILLGIIVSIIAHGYFIKRTHEFDFARGILTAVLSAVLLTALVVAVSVRFLG